MFHPIHRTFYFSNISREQCREAGAMISFTLMDWDVLTADDFGGEAFIALRLEILFSYIIHFRFSCYYVLLVFRKVVWFYSYMNVYINTRFSCSLIK